MESLVSIKDATRYHFVSIQFHEVEIDSTIRPTMKIFRMKNKYFHTFWHFKFIFHVKSFHCGSDYAVNLMIVKVDWNVIITCFIILMDEKSHFHAKITFWTTKFSLFKKRKPANLLCPVYRFNSTSYKSNYDIVNQWRLFWNLCLSSFQESIVWPLIWNLTHRIFS